MVKGISGPKSTGGGVGNKAAKKGNDSFPKHLKRPAAAAKDVEHSKTAENAVVRRFKYHEKKLLKKVDFMQYAEDNWHESYCIPKYHLTDREDYRRYLRMVGMMRSLMGQLRALPPSSKIRIEVTDNMLRKLYDMGLIQERLGLAEVDKLGVEAFCKRRLSAVLVKLNMAGNHRIASEFVEHGHVRVGVTQVRDPAYVVPRALESLVTWTDKSKIRKHVDNFNAERDDFQ